MWVLHPHPQSCFGQINGGAVSMDAQLKMDTADLEAFLTREFPQVDGTFSIEALTSETLTVRLHVTDAHLRPGGTVSGPTMFMAADVGVYLAVLARLGPVALAVTTNCSIDFMRKPLAGADLLSVTRILKLGKSLAVGDVLIYSEGHAAPVARATLTYAIPPGQ